MSITATISGVSVLVGNASFTLTDPLENRSILTFIVLDSSGTASYSRGQPVTFADPGIISYTGYVQSDQPTKDGLALPYVEHVITCMDGVYNLDKRSNETNYLNWQAGNIAMDFVRRDLLNEGITMAAAMHHDTTDTDFNQGNLSGLVGIINTSNGVSDDGDLELALAGGTITITEQTTSDFASGTLTNVAASNNSLSPTTVSAIQMIADLPVSLAASDSISMTVWSGSMLVAANDTLNYDIWISSSSPAFKASIDLVFSDGSLLSSYTGTSYVSLVDQNFLAPGPTIDLTSFANNTWYTRNISLSSLSGKTINNVLVAVAGTSPGTYTIFFKNLYLGSQSGSPFFSTTATATQTNPPTLYASTGYISTLTFVTVVQVAAGTTIQRTSPAHSIDPVKLVGSSLITWSAITPLSSTVQVAVSYDGNAFLLCTNNKPLPSLPPGSNVAGLSLYLQEIFAPGTLPTALPSLTSVSIILTPAPNASKTDISANYGSATTWNTGKYAGTSVNANGALTLGSLSRNWSDGLFTGQTALFNVGTQSVVGGWYTMTATIAGEMDSRLDFTDICTDFVAEWDMYSTWSGSEEGGTGIVFRSTCRLRVRNGGASPQIWIDNGVTTLAFSSTSFTSGVSHHFKLIVKGQVYQVYLDGSSLFSVIDTVGNVPAPLELLTFANTAPITGSFNNFVLTPSIIGTWQSASNSLAALSTIENSVISWLETLASGAPSSAAIVQTSIDNGNTWKLCTNNAQIPGLTPGTSVSALSLLVRITLFSTTVVSQPVIGGLNWRVLSAFPTITGSRSTAPIGNDTMVRANQSEWGSAFDGQTWSRIGTATAAISGNAATLTNTTGDAHEILGSNSWSEEEATVRFQLSASTISAGIELRYLSSSHYYRLAVSTTAISIIKNIGSGNTTLATASITLSTGTWYRMRFRAVGVYSASLYGKVWADGSLEPGVSLGYMSTTSPQWNVTATD